MARDHREPDRRRGAGNDLRVRGTSRRSLDGRRWRRVPIPVPHVPGLAFARDRDDGSCEPADGGGTGARGLGCRAAVHPARRDLWRRVRGRICRICVAASAIARRERRGRRGREPDPGVHGSRERLSDRMVHQRVGDPGRGRQPDADVARDSVRRVALRDKLRHAPQTMPLFDRPRFVRNLERAYAQMAAIAVAGGAPEGFDLR